MNQQDPLASTNSITKSNTYRPSYWTPTIILQNDPPSTTSDYQHYQNDSKRRRTHPATECSSMIPQNTSPVCASTTKSGYDSLPSSNCHSPSPPFANLNINQSPFTTTPTNSPLQWQPHHLIRSQSMTGLPSLMATSTTTSHPDPLYIQSRGHSPMQSMIDLTLDEQPYHHQQQLPSITTLNDQKSTLHRPYPRSMPIQHQNNNTSSYGLQSFYNPDISRPFSSNSSYHLPLSHFQQVPATSIVTQPSVVEPSQQEERSDVMLMENNNNNNNNSNNNNGIDISTTTSANDNMHDDDDDDDDVIIDEEMTNRNICIGMLKSDVVTKDPLFLVKDELFEPVLMRMEGYRQNNYSFTITSKKNPTKFYGWVPFDDTSILGPIAERQMVWWDTVIPRNKANMTRTPLYIILYCRPNVYDKLCQYLFKWKLDLQDPPFFNPACRYSNPKFSKNNLIPQQEQQRESFTTTGTMYHSNSSNNNDSNSYLGQAKRGITQLLESIPSHRQGDKGNRPIVINDEEGDATYKDDNDEPQNEIKEDDLNMKGLTITLLPHQLEGIRWMMDREENESSSGGILADDMGLGKTIQTIGLVTSTLENTEKRENKTLIVAPLALIQQWAREFEMKTTPGNIKVLIHHGGDRTKNHRDFDDYDVVVTTYQIVASDLELSGTGKKRGRQQQQQQQPIVIGEDASMIETIDDGTNFESDVSASSSRLASPAPSSSAGQQQRYSEDDDDKDNKVSTLDCGPLFQVQWYRVVLDEAQQIKNHKTRSSIACSKLISSKRWCLTGTPIQNRVDELYSLLRFLRIQPLCELATFRHTISGPIQSGKVDIALGRLKAILMVIMLRRTKQILNATSSASSSSSPKVPTSSSSASSPPPTTTTNSSGSSTPTETSSSLVFGLPCRQKEDILLEFSSNERALYDVLIRKTKSTVERLVQSGKGTRNYMNMLCMLLRLRQACNHPDLVLRSLSNDEDIMAFASAENSSTTTSSSKRETSEAAMQRLLMAQMAADLGWSGVGQVGQSVFDKSSSKHQCELCGRPVIVMDSEETCGNNNNNMTNTPPYCVNCTNQIKLYTNKATSTISMNSASTKINKMLEILEETRQHYPNEKTIIFSQFSSMLDLMEKPLQGLGFKFCRYDGSMANHAREKSLHVLRTDPECRVMLISLKCGSLGLNLTAANRVILMDIWWNPAVEDQAIDRVHRIGQKLPVYVTRLLIDRTIEQKIIKLQEHKARIAKGALGDHMTGTNKLTTQELLALFDL